LSSGCAGLAWLGGIAFTPPNFRISPPLAKIPPKREASFGELPQGEIFPRLGQLSLFRGHSCGG
jgi:hypothetical protein